MQRRRLHLFTSGLLVLASAAVPAGVGAQARLAPTEIAARAREATVQIRALDERGQTSGSGSGFIVTADGTLVTNYHVIQDARSLQVELASGEIYDNVFFITADPRRDLAVLRIAAEATPVLPLGSDSDAEVGESVYVMGNPLGQTNTFSNGIVSARRTMEGVQMLQITAPISPGSSGGPVMDGGGTVIGIATMMMQSGQNLNYAVPARYIRPLISTGEAPRRFAASVLPVPASGGLVSSATDERNPPSSGASPVAPAESVSRWDSQLGDRLAVLESVFVENGMQRSHSIDRSSLREAQAAEWTVDLLAGRLYGFVGVCDADCRDLDLYVYDPRGNLVKADNELDANPAVVFAAAATGTYRIQVRMITCSVAPCFYTIAGYTRR